MQTVPNNPNPAQPVPPASARPPLPPSGAADPTQGKIDPSGGRGRPTRNRPRPRPNSALVGGQELQHCPHCGSWIHAIGLNLAIFEREDMRSALAARDIATVFRILQRFGLSQRQIGLLTSQAQSEVSEILGGRHVVSYRVLARIADGLSIPRRLMGLADAETSPPPQDWPDNSTTGLDT